MVIPLFIDGCQISTPQPFANKVWPFARTAQVSEITKADIHNLPLLHLTINMCLGITTATCPEQEVHRSHTEFSSIWIGKNSSQPLSFHSAPQSNGIALELLMQEYGQRGRTRCTQTKMRKENRSSPLRRRKYKVGTAIITVISCCLAILYNDLLKNLYSQML